MPYGGHAGSTGTTEGVQNQIAGPGGGLNDALKQIQGFLCGVVSQKLLGFGSQRTGPNIGHLSAAVHLLHQVIAEDALGLVLHRPDDEFGGMLEATAAQIGRRIGLLPGDDIAGNEPGFVQALSYIKKVMEGSADEDAAGDLQQPITLRNPLHIEIVHFLRGKGLVPVALIDLDPLSAGAGCSSIGQKIGWVRKHEVYGVGLHGPHSSGAVIVDELKRNRQCSYSLSRKEERVCHLYSFRRRRHIKAPA